MRNPLVMLIVLAMLLMTIVAPFSGLAMLMVILFLSAFVWTLSTLVRSFFVSDPQGQK